MIRRHDEYITEARTHARKLYEAYLALKGMQPEWVSQDYGNTLSNGEQLNEGYTKAEVGAVVNTTVDAITVLLGAGHGTNITNLL